MHLYSFFLIDTFNPAQNRSNFSEEVLVFLRKSLYLCLESAILPGYFLVKYLSLCRYSSLLARKAASVFAGLPVWLGFTSFATLELSFYCFSYECSRWMCLECVHCHIFRLRITCYCLSFLFNFSYFFHVIKIRSVA